MNFDRVFKKWLIRVLLAVITAVLCGFGSPVFAKFTSAIASSQNSSLSPHLASSNSGDRGAKNSIEWLQKVQDLQAAGLYRRACGALLQGLQVSKLDCSNLLGNELSEKDKEILQNLPETPLNVTGLRMLGNVLRMMGALQNSTAVLEQSLAIAVQSEDISLAHLSLGNTRRDRGKREEELNNKPQAEIEYTAALKEYDKAIASSVSDSTRLRVKLNQLNLFIENYPKESIANLWHEVKAGVDNLPASSEAIYARIDLAESLTCLKLRTIDKEERKLWRSPSPPIAKLCPFQEKIDAPDWQSIGELLATAAEQSQKLGFERSRSLALGFIGELYEVNQQWLDARKLTEEALKIAQSIQAWDIAYKWQWQLGRAIVKMEGNREEAIAAYQAAVDSTKSLRRDLATINLDVQFSFRDRVDPVYRQYVDLLLPQPGNQPILANLKKAREVIADLQVAELENFLKCTLQVKNPVSLDQVAQDNNAAILYPIILPERLGVIVKLPTSDELLYYETRIDPDEVNRKLETLRQELEYRRVTPEGKRLSQEIYNWLIRPAENYPDRPLDPSQVKTLVFVLDGRFRNIPMAALLDDQQYLVEKYAIALNLGLELPKPLPFRQMRIEALTAGLTEDVRELNRLQFAGRELDSIKSLVPSTEIRDGNFVTTNFKNLISSQFFSVVHLVTHGQFSSQPEKTSIEAYDDSIKVEQLRSIFQTQSQRRPDPIELLVLSACQTAAGDNRAVLGLAGVAVQSGARSTIASLWYLNDESSAILMNRFYRYLQDPNVPNKAEALRLAQQEQMKDKNYNYKAPSYWAAFVLVGNWL